MYEPCGQYGEQLGIAVIGAGYWGMNYVRILSELRDTYVAVVCDGSSERLDEVHSRFPGIPLTTDLDEALGVDGVAAAVVSTPATTHRDVAGTTLSAGIHTLVEKPLTTTGREADELVAIAAERSCVLSVGHTFVYNPGVQKLREYAHGGDIGLLYYLYARRTSLGPIRYDVNALWDLAAHDVSIFNFILGERPTTVSAVGATILGNSRHDVGFVTLRYGDVLGHVHVSWADPHKVREVVLVASDKRVVFNDLDPMERVRVYDKGVRPAAQREKTSFGEFQFDLRDGDIQSPRVPGVEPLKAVCTHFVDCVRDGARPLTDGSFGRDVVLVLEAIDRSISRDGAPVPVEHPDDPFAGELLLDLSPASVPPRRAA